MFRFKLYYRKYWVYIVIIVLCALFYHLYRDYVEKNTKNLELFVDNKVKMMFFYADWCGHCKTFKPEWEKFVKKVSKDELLKGRVILSKYNSDKEKEVFNKYAIKSFPTVLLIDKDANIQTFNGERSVEGLLSFLNENI
jgi:protein disulfide-isomerase-like protein